MSTIILATGSNEFGDRVRRAVGEGFTGPIETWHAPDVAADDALQTVKLIMDRHPDVVCLGPDMATGTAFDIAAAFDQEHPEIGVIVVTKQTAEAFERALRTGVRDVLAPDADDATVRAIFDRVIESSRRARYNVAANTGGSVPTRGKVISVVAPKGGAGKTTVAANLAAALSHRGEGPVALVDLDLQFGDVAGALGLDPEHTIGGLATVPGGVTSTNLKVFLTRRSDDLYVLCAPHSPAEGEQVPERVIEKVLRLLSEEFAFVVVDTSAGVDPATLATIDQSTDLVMLCDLSVSALRGLRKVVAALDELDVSAPRRHFVLNRSDSRVGIEADEAAAVVGMEVDIEIPESRTVPLAMNHGIAIVEEAPRSAVARVFESMADLFTAEPRGRRGLFSFRGGR